MSEFALEGIGRHQQQAEQAEQSTRREQAARLAELAARPLTGSRGDIGQGVLFGDGDLFSGPAPVVRDCIDGEADDDDDGPCEDWMLEPDADIAGVWNGNQIESDCESDF